MEKLYNDEYVACIDYDIFREDLCKGTIKLDIDDIKKYTCYQHAIIKFLETSKPNTMVFKILAKFYEDFFKYPYLFVNSPLLNDSVIEKYADQLEKDKIRDFDNKYYDLNRVIVLSPLFFKDKMSDKEKQMFFSVLIRDLKTTNACDSKRVIKHLINSNKSIKELSDIELQFIGQYAAMYCNKKADVLITKEHPAIKSCDTRGLITINRDAKDIVDYEDFIYAACYASRFSRAESVVGIDVNQQYELAVHLLFNKYLDEADWVLYNKEYIYSSLYKYSCDKGYFDAQITLATLGKEELADELLKDKMKDIHKNSSVYQHDLSSKPLMLKKEEEMLVGEFPASSFITTHLDEIISKHPGELKNYPILNLFYNEYGKRKPFNQIFESYVKDSKASSCLYGNFISQGINDGQLDKLQLPDKTEDIYNTFNSLGNLFHDKMMVLYTYLKSNNQTNAEELGYSILYQINQLACILNYVINNIDILVEVTKNKGRINQNCLLFRFLNDFKEFDYNNIKNESILNNHYVMYAIIQLEVLRIDLNNKFNKAFIDERIEGLSDDDKEKIITLPDGRELSLVNFLYQEVLPNTNYNLEYVDGDKKTYITTLIDGYVGKRSNSKKH